MTDSTNARFLGTDIPSLLEQAKGINVLLSLTCFPLTYTNSKGHRNLHSLQEHMAINYTAAKRSRFLLTLWKS